MASVIPYFELHIEPMFRAIDRRHMIARMDLWGYDSVKAHARDIARMLRVAPPRGMPTKAFGGPWPEGWIKVFEEWVELGCPRLSKTKGSYNLVRLGPDKLLLSLSVPLANGAENAWVNLELTPPTFAEYTLFLRPAPTGEIQPPTSAEMKEIISGAQITAVFINDSDGRQSIAITS